MTGPRIQPRLEVIVRAAGKPGYHPRPVTMRYKLRGAEVITWWELCAVGWHAVRAAALAAGLCQVNLLRPGGDKGCVAAWRSLDAAAIWDYDPSRQLEPRNAEFLVELIGLPTAAQVAHQKYQPVAKCKPRGYQSAATRLIKGGLPIEVTSAAADILAMFAGMDDCEDKRRHVKFWSAVSAQTASTPAPRSATGEIVLCQ